MTASETIAPAEARALSERLSEPAVLAEARAQALERFLGTESPHRAQHLWRYTDPAEMEAMTDPFDSAHDGGVTLRVKERAHASGVTVLPFARAASEERSAFESVFGQLVGADFGRFEALNGAAYRSGLFIHVARNAQVEAPIVIEIAAGDARWQASRVAILVEEGASVTVMEELRGGDDGAGSTKATQQLSHVSEMVVGPNATVHHVMIETHGRRTNAMLTQRARLERGAIYRPVLAAFGGALTKVDVGALLVGDGAQSEMSGFLSGIGRQRFDHHTVHHHLARHTHSNLNFRTVLKDKARSAYTGLIRIEKEAPFSEAYQENRNLLLSNTCRAESIPELEILTQEVQCKHGATVGPLDPAHLFYLMSRAIPRDEAVRIIVAGHFEETLRSLPAALRDSLESLLLERLRSI